MLTEESNPRTNSIDELPTADILRVMNEEDATVAQVIHDALPAVTRAVDTIVAAFLRGGRLIYIGAGTSGRLGVLDAVECIPTFGVSPDLVIGLIAGGIGAMTRAIEGAEDRVQDGHNDLIAINLSIDDVVVGIAASGSTPYVLGAVEYANKMNADTIGIACNAPSPLLDCVKIPIGLPVGPEVIAGSTRLKAGTAQKMVLNMLSTASMVKLGKVYGNQMVDVLVTNEKLGRRAERIVAEVADISLDDAQALLKRAGNRLKTAIVMHVKQTSASEADRLLNEANGNLRSVIG